MFLCCQIVLLLICKCMEKKSFVHNEGEIFYIYIKKKKDLFYKLKKMKAVINCGFGGD